MLNPGYEAPGQSSSWYVASRKPARIVHRHQDAIKIADTSVVVDDEIVLAGHPGGPTRVW